VLFATFAWLSSLRIDHLPPRQPQRRIRVNVFAEAR
jgi:hypothetical protein